MSRVPDSLKEMVETADYTKPLPIADEIERQQAVFHREMADQFMHALVVQWQCLGDEVDVVKLKGRVQHFVEEWVVFE